MLYKVCVSHISVKARDNSTTGSILWGKASRAAASAEATASSDGPRDRGWCMALYKEHMPLEVGGEASILRFNTGALSLLSWPCRKVVTLEELSQRHRRRRK
mmetsp:Transcript_35272/g.73437  ORF Transcript_35272/g.73437 Transcript_35272/m.73437 type:complete len:102 (+) Transcript_35272:250-555(+)